MKPSLIVPDTSSVIFIAMYYPPSIPEKQSATPTRGGYMGGVPHENKNLTKTIIIQNMFIQIFYIIIYRYVTVKISYHTGMRQTEHKLYDKSEK